MLAITEAPHDRLLPLMAGAIHHGGAGTTAAAIRAGIPQVVVPFFADQPFWGRRVAWLGLGPDPIPRRRLDPTALATALRLALGRAAPRRQAARLGEVVRAVDGAGTAADLLERIAGREVT